MLALIAAVYTSILFYNRGVSLKKAVFLVADLATDAVPPALRATLSVSLTAAAARYPIPAAAAAAAAAAADDDDDHDDDDDDDAAAADDDDYAAAVVVVVVRFWWWSCCCCCGCCC